MTLTTCDAILCRKIEAKVYGVLCFGMGLTLREGRREYFYQQLDHLFPVVCNMHSAGKVIH